MMAIIIMTTNYYIKKFPSLFSITLGIFYFKYKTICIQQHLPNMPPSFENKIVLITGAGSGIGRGPSIKLAKPGATLALADIIEASVSETLELCTRKGHYTSAFDIGLTEK
jgi:hypothetical protein